jgi:hypothetical protein
VKSSSKQCKRLLNHWANETPGWYLVLTSRSQVRRRFEGYGLVGHKCNGGLKVMMWVGRSQVKGRFEGYVGW